MDFATSYKQLNAAQRQAVDTIEGPVLVVAGPGTGKTQLLSMRAANILRLTDTSPQNILCLTFTESGAMAMRRRLIKLMGPEGNNVAVHTFHSFGADIINRWREYFYNGAQFEPADNLASHAIYQTIFEALPHSSPLAKTMNGEFTSLGDAQKAISHLKKAGLLPDELIEVLDHNQEFCNETEPQLAKIFAQRFSKKDFPKFSELLESFAGYSPKISNHAKPLAALCTSELAAALAEAESSGKTTPITAWRNRWLEKNARGDFVFKDRKQGKKLRALAKIYAEYQKQLESRQLFDFDDMISMVAHTLETQADLRFNLQEQFLYIMVDEFQDTNGAQNRLLSALADNPANEGQPNILAVGDDDQAIYSFQGAELSNILDFTRRYKNTKIITLADNYRSTAEILKHSRSVITQGQERLENTLEAINKELTAHTKAETESEIHQFTGQQSEYDWVAEDVAKRIAGGESPQEIAVIARGHKQLIDLVPYIHAKNIAINYEKRNDVLKNPAICELLTVAHVIVHLADQRFDLAESHLPEMLSYNFWGLSPKEIWELSLNAHKQNRLWLELMLDSSGKLRRIAEFVIIASQQCQNLSLDTMLDIIIGNNELQVPDDGMEPLPILDSTGPSEEEFTSPYRAHYFNQHKLASKPAEYLELLSNLHALRRALQNWHQDEEEPLRLPALLDFVELHLRTQTPVLSTVQTLEAEQSISLMTAHKAKGLEFSTVYILSGQDEIWGRKTRHRVNSISFPRNMPIEPAGANYDDALRLFFVAMTRAKQNLLITQHQLDNSGKEHLPAEFLTDSQIKIVEHSKEQAPKIEHLRPDWQAKLRDLPKQDQKALLAPILENYKLSATHVNNFMDITRGGPQAFLLQNLLRFPQGMTPSQAFGKAIHGALQNAHAHLSATGQPKPAEDILRDYEVQLLQSRLSERDLERLLEKGSDILQNYLTKRYFTFNQNQKAERNFASQHVVVAGVRITGAIDLMEIDEQAKEATVTDYKTGKGAGDWHGKTDYEKIKLHKYKQQLMFYKLLVENSADFKAYKMARGVLDFIEPDDTGELHRLTLQISQDDLKDFVKLIVVIWQKIQTLDLPDTSSYEPSYKGILRFEHDLLANQS